MVLLLQSGHLFSCGFFPVLERLLVSHLVPVVHVLSQLGLDPGVVLDLPPRITGDTNKEFLLTKKLIWILLIGQHSLLVLNTIFILVQFSHWSLLHYVIWDLDGSRVPVLLGGRHVGSEELLALCLLERRLATLLGSNAWLPGVRRQWWLWSLGSLSSIADAEQLL